MDFLAKHTWILLMIFPLINFYQTRQQYRRYGYPKPHLKKGYDLGIKRILILYNIPLIVMAIGDLFGLVHYSIEYFNTKNLTLPIVIMFHLSIWFSVIFIIRWIYFRKGAEFIEEHEGLFTKYGYHGSTSWNSKQIKVFVVPLYLGVVAVVYLLLWSIGNY